MLDGKLKRVRRERKGSVENRRVAENERVIAHGLGLANGSAGGCFAEHIHHFKDEPIRGNQLMLTGPVVISQANRLVGMWLCENPANGHGRIEDVLHSPFRISLRIGRVISSKPSRVRMSSRSRSISSAACRITSGSRTLLSAISRLLSTSSHSSRGISVSICLIIRTPFSYSAVF